eukprot:TRINITY_DN5114_c0_g1_i1.p1 TRINITY_DN5114_c0_g1~~TRINITY_DN5114_c0_g1_i1.p1  ORF type:complete len:480 (-),score=93.60 TRINITY_DN5114_c0_g1_i1:17-1456(-)
MGKFGRLFRSRDNEEIEEAEEVQGRCKEGDVHCLVCGLDYSCDKVSWAGPPPTGGGPLDTGYAFKGMQGLMEKCSVASMKKIWNQECTRQGMRAAVAEVGSKCKPGDYFVLYYTGHGNPLAKTTPALPGKETEDQCILTVDEFGSVDDAQMSFEFRNRTWLRDDEFADILVTGVPKGVKMIMLLDCCHSATMCDFDEDNCWAQLGNQAISIAGSGDSETSAGTGAGGKFTRALSRAIAAMQQAGKEHYGTDKIYNVTLKEYQAHQHDSHQQTISIRSINVHPGELVWPLEPTVPYESPADLDRFADTAAERTQAGIPRAQPARVPQPQPQPGQPVQYMQPGQPVPYMQPGQPVQYMQQPGQPVQYMQPGQPVQYMQQAMPGMQAAPVARPVAAAPQPMTYPQQPQMMAQPQVISAPGQAPIRYAAPAAPRPVVYSAPGAAGAPQPVVYKAPQPIQVAAGYGQPGRVLVGAPQPMVVRRA